jgi:hypothetical protein
MNMKRVWIGGISSGVAMLVINFIGNIAFLEKRYMALTPSYYYKEPILPYFPGLVLITLAVGVGLAWLYASVRPRLGPGPKTAGMLGITVALMMHLPSNFAEASWSTAGRYIPFMQMVIGLVAVTAGSLVAGALYKE